MKIASASRPLLALLALALMLAPACQPIQGLLNSLPNAARGAAGGGILRIHTLPPATLDPALAQDYPSWQIVYHVFDRLVTLDDDLKVKPSLAAKWTLSDDGRRYLFELRKDVKFNDGTPFSARDVKYSFERALDPNLKSAAALLYLGDIKGAKERQAGQANEVAGVRVVDSFTVEIELDEPKTYFLSKLTSPITSIVKIGSANAPDWPARSAGTGPFYVAEWRRGESVALKRNEFYYGPRPSLAEVRFTFLAGSPMQAYRDGQLDVALIGLEDLGQLSPSESSSELVVTPVLTTWYLGLNTRFEPFDDLHLRRALALATDRSALVNDLLKKARTEAYAITPPNLPGSGQARASSFDLVAAKRELQQSRYGNADQVPEIVLSVAGTGSRKVAEAIAKQYRDGLNLRVTVREMSDTQFYGDLLAGRLQMFYVAWSADYPDVQNYLETLFLSDSAGNQTGYRDQIVDGLLQQAAGEQDAARRESLYQQAEAKLLADAPVIPLFYDSAYHLVSRRVAGLKWNSLGIGSLATSRVQ